MHYVPISVDFSELHDAFVFFRGDLTGKGRHDVLARRIAESARHWTQTYARQEDMTAYMFRYYTHSLSIIGSSSDFIPDFRLFLEYARVMSKDREAMTINQRRERSIRHGPGQARHKS